MRAYLRYSPRTFHDKAVVDRYPPGAFAAFGALLCLAEEQPERGRFRSERLLRLLLDEPEDGVKLGWGKWVPFLIEHGDLVRQDRGVLYVVGWDEWQEGDFTVAERVARLRRKRRDDVTADVTDAVTADVTGPVTGARLAVGGRPKAVGGGGRRPQPPPTVANGKDDGPVATWLLLARSGPTAKARAWMLELAGTHGDGAVSAAMVEAWQADPDRRTLLSRVQGALAASAADAEAARQEAGRAAAADVQRRFDEMTVEQRAANMERLRAELEASGLLPPGGSK